MTDQRIKVTDAQHSVVAHDPAKWCAVPANNGGNSPTWQWGDELLVGFTMGEFGLPGTLHQTLIEGPFTSWLARSLDGGDTWSTFRPSPYAGQGTAVAPLPAPLDFSAPGFVLRVEAYGYHGNGGAQWYASLDRGAAWQGPYRFGDLLDQPDLVGCHLTARTGYLLAGPDELLLFLSVRPAFAGEKTTVLLTDKPIVARMRDGGRRFEFVSWVVDPDDPCRAVMPAPVRLSEDVIVVALRRKSDLHNWVDVYGSEDNGRSWHFRSRVGETETGNTWNGNPPAMVRMEDGRLCCVYGNRSRRQIIARVSADGGTVWGPEYVVRDDYCSVNGLPDLGYPRLFCRPDGKLVTVYFWATAESPQTYVAATAFSV